MRSRVRETQPLLRPSQPQQQHTTRAIHAHLTDDVYTPDQIQELHTEQSRLRNRPPLSSSGSAPPTSDHVLSRPNVLFTKTERSFVQLLQQYVDHNGEKTICANPFFTNYEKIESKTIDLVPHNAVTLKLLFHISDLASRTSPTWGYFDPYPQPQTVTDEIPADEENEKDKAADEEEEETKEEDSKALILPPENPDPYFGSDGFPMACHLFNVNATNWVQALKVKHVPWTSAFPYPILLADEVVEIQWDVMLNPMGAMSTFEFHDLIFDQKRQGRFDIHLPGETLKAMISGGCTHIVPYAIWITEEHNTLPFPLAAQLYSTTDTHIEEKPSHFHGKVTETVSQVPWFNECIANPDQTDQHRRVVGHVIFPGIHQTTPRVLKYRADEQRVGHPDFARWASTDFREVETMLKSSDFQSATEKDNMYSIQAPPLYMIHAENVLQFVCMDEWLRIERLSKLRQLTSKELAAKIKKSDVKKDYSFRVHKNLFNQLIQEKKDLVDRDRSMIRLDTGLRFELSLLSTDGVRQGHVDQYWTNKLQKAGKSYDANDFSITYMCKLHIACVKVPPKTQ
jgi:hypothetical protein